VTARLKESRKVNGKSHIFCMSMMRFFQSKLRDRVQNYAKRARRLPLPPKARQDKGRPSVRTLLSGEMVVPTLISGAHGIFLIFGKSSKYERTARVEDTFDVPRHIDNRAGQDIGDDHAVRTVAFDSAASHAIAVDWPHQM
jgi:hypothetical protein